MKSKIRLHSLSFDYFLFFYFFFFGFGSSILGSVGNLGIIGFLARDASLAFFLYGSLLAFGRSIFFHSFALFQTFGNSAANGVEDNFDRFRSIVVGRNYEIYVVRIGVGIDHGKYGNTQTVGLAYGDVLFENIDNKQGRRRFRSAMLPSVFSNLAR